jgi:hypothetical protein
MLTFYRCQTPGFILQPGVFWYTRHTNEHYWLGAGFLSCPSHIFLPKDFWGRSRGKTIFSGKVFFKEKQA